MKTFVRSIIAVAAVTLAYSPALADGHDAK